MLGAAVAPAVFVCGGAKQQVAAVSIAVRLRAFGRHARRGGRMAAGVHVVARAAERLRDLGGVLLCINRASPEYHQ